MFFKGTYKIQDIWNTSLTLAIAHFKNRNEGSYLGILWYLLEPLTFFFVLLFLGGAIYNNSIDQYPAYLLLGLIMFNFFSSITNGSTGVIFKNKIFIRSIKIDPLVFVFKNVLQSIFSHFFEIILFALLLVYLKLNLAFLLFYPLLFIFFILFTTGMALIFATIGVFVGDWENIWAVLVKLIWFVTPIFYIMEGSNTMIAKINYINPIAHFITISRNIIIYERIPTYFSVIGIIMISVFTFVIGLSIFNKFKKKFAERI